MTNKDFNDEYEELTGMNCPMCGYPTVFEYGLEVCYKCGWNEDMQDVSDI